MTIIRIHTFFIRNISSTQPQCSQLFNGLSHKWGMLYMLHLCSCLRLGLLIKLSIFVMIFNFNTVNQIISLKQPHLFISTFLSKDQPQGVA